jgi:hypothetical protein
MEKEGMKAKFKVGDVVTNIYRADQPGFSRLIVDLTSDLYHWVWINKEGKQSKIIHLSGISNLEENSILDPYWLHKKVMEVINGKV